MAQFLTAVLDTLRRHYGINATTGGLYKKGTREEPRADLTLLFGGTNERGRVLFSLGGPQSVFDKVVARGPKRAAPPLETLMDLIGEAMCSHAGPVKKFRRLVPTIVKGSEFTQTFLTTGSTAIVPLNFEGTHLTLQISREAVSL